MDTIQPFIMCGGKSGQAEAECLLADSRYLWNAGIFLFSPDTLLAEAAERRPELLSFAG